MAHYKNLHVPLSEELYQSLRLVAAETHRPATDLAREAIHRWIEAWKKEQIARELLEFAKEYAGTEWDLDPELEAAGIENWMKNID